MIVRSIILLLSGGLDSIVLLYDLYKQGLNIHCVLFDYGQTHVNELSFAEKHCIKLGVKFTRVELFRIKNMFLHCRLTDGESGNIVPNRNAVFINIGAALAMSANADAVLIGCNKDDQQEFPDCRWEFINATNAALKAAQVPVEVCAPYIGLTKWQIVQRAKEIGAPYLESVSCYEGNECGECDACVKRAKAVA